MIYSNLTGRTHGEIQIARQTGSQIDRYVARQIAIQIDRQIDRQIVFYKSEKYHRKEDENKIRFCICLCMEYFMLLRHQMSIEDHMMSTIIILRDTLYMLGTHLQLSRYVEFMTPVRFEPGTSRDKCLTTASLEPSR